MDDLSGFMGALAGLANDARNGAMEKAEKIKQSMRASEDIETLREKISELESRIESLENNSAVKSKS